MTDRLRITGPQFAIIRSLLMRGGARRAVALSSHHRQPALPLWRRGIIEIWYRQSPDMQPALQGPYFSLSNSGLHLASLLFPAPRGISSGAEQHL